MMRENKEDQPERDRDLRVEGLGKDIFCIDRGSY